MSSLWGLPAGCLQWPHIVARSVIWVELNFCLLSNTSKMSWCHWLLWSISRVVFVVLGLQQDSFSCYAESWNPCLSQMAHSFCFYFSVAVWLQCLSWLLYIDPHSVELLNVCLILNVHFCFRLSVLNYFLSLVWFKVGCAEGCTKMSKSSDVPVT